jgi:malate dehydrogenase
VSIGVPVVLGRKGVERILELNLSPNVRPLFEKSVSIIKEALGKLEPEG